MAGHLKSSGNDEKAWLETTAAVVSSEYHYAKWWKVDEAYDTDQSYFVTTFSYIVEGTMYFGTGDSWGPVDVGESFSICYDPSDPNRNSTVKPKKTVGQWLLVWGFGLLVAIMLIYLQQRFGLPEGD